MNVPLAVGFSDPDQQEAAIELAKTLQLPVNKTLLPRLEFTDLGLAFLAIGFSPLYVEFNTAHWQRRRDAGKQQGLVRACKPRSGLKILDLTAGWGRDAAILASYGAEVTMVERHPIMAALLEDGLRRMEPQPSAPRLRLIHQDSMSYLQTLSSADYPNVIYIDPMHPTREKSALVKKDMQILQAMIGVDDDACALIQMAITKVKSFVVVKWPQRAPALIPATNSIPGKTVRFDVYRTHKEERSGSLSKD